MLSLGATSSCDICFEQFGQDLKAPWSIECGHIFCGECLGAMENVNAPRLCPMCRSPFQHESCIRLRVEVDVDSAELSPTAAANAKEARRIQHIIAHIPETGATESSLRQLIQEGNDFLNTQPRNSHKELRNAHRIISYLFDVKLSYRKQAVTIEALKEQVNLLTKEKTELSTQLDKLEETRLYEKDTASAVEATLREHCNDAKQSQKVAEEQLRKVEQENADLKKQLRLPSSRWISKPTYTLPEPAEPVSTDKYFEMPSAFSKLDMSSVAIQDPSSFLISPHPQFNDNSLPFDILSPLPDLAADEDESPEASTDDEDDEVVTPDRLQHRPQLHPTPSTSTYSSPVPPRPILEPSGLSRTAPFREHRRRERSSSSPSRLSSRSQSPFDIIMPSASTTPPAQTTAIHHGTLSRDAHIAPPIQDKNVLRSRLQDILSDTSASSSLPTIASFSPSSLSRDPSNRSKDDRSHAGSSKSSEPFLPTAPQQVPNNGTHSHVSTSQTTSSKAPTSSSPNHPVGLRMSSASAEAKKLEEERRRKHREEKSGADHEKLPVDADREHRRYAVPSNTTSGTAVPTSSASQAARREQQSYGNPLNSMNGNNTSSLKRNGSMNSSSYTWQPPATYSQEQGTAPPNRQPYKTPSKSSTLQSSHGPTVYT